MSKVVMNSALYKIAANVSTPLALAGITVALFSGIAIRVIDSPKLASARPEDTPDLFKYILSAFFVLAIVAFVMGGCGYAYVKYLDHSLAKSRKATQIRSCERLAELLTVIRNESGRLVDQYAVELEIFMKTGSTAEEAKIQIIGLSRRSIDRDSLADTLGLQLRMGFPEYNWTSFFAEGKEQFRMFREEVHKAAINGDYRERRFHLEELRRNYLRHLEERLEEIRGKSSI